MGDCGASCFCQPFQIESPDSDQHSLNMNNLFHDWGFGALPRWAGYMTGLILFATALAVRFAMAGFLPPSGFPFLTFFPAVMLTALFAGLQVSILVSVLSILAAWYYFIEPIGKFNGLSQADLIALIFFAAVLLVDCVIIHVMTTALKRLNEATRQLRLSESRIRGVLDNLFVYVGLLDLQGRLCEVNHAPLQLAGLERGQVLKQPLWDTPWWVDETEREKLRDAIRRAANGEAVRYDAIIHCSEGVRLTIDFQIAPLYEEMNAATTLVFSGVDVSSRVNALAALEQSRLQAVEDAQRIEAKRRLIDAIFNAVPAGIIVADATGRLVMMNPANRQIWGLAPFSEDVSEYADWKGWWADGSARHGQRILPHEWGMARALNGETCAEIVEVEPFGYPGVRHLTQLSAAPILAADGSVQGGVVAQIDITALMAAEQALREKEVRLALALKASGTAVWEMDVAEQKIIPADDSLCRMLGFSPGELRSMHDWIDLVHEDDRQELMAMITAVIRGEHESYGIELRLRTKEGGWRWVLAQAIASKRDSHGQATRLVGTNSDITERKAAEQRVRDAALHDSLTGLPNRALVFEYGGHLLAGAQRRQRNGALLFIDLDRFKPINDIYGHHIGDLVLKEVARRLRLCTREEDLVGRLGGDEFVVMLQPLEKAYPRAAVIAQHVVDQISQPFHIETLELSLTPSIGISYYPQHAANVSALIHTADLAMYQAKQSGRANFQIYTPELDANAEAAYALEMRLRKALRNGQFDLHYQPVVDIASGQLVGAEALVRLADNDAYKVGPQHFIPIAESSGLIGDIGEWVISEACRQHRAWQREGINVTVAVNVSPLQFRQAGFSERMGEILSAMEVNPKYVQLEVTESMIMENVDEAVQILNRIKALGVKIALDDFGTGYSSLSRLSSLPLDKLKVDQSFVRGIESDPASRAVTDAVIALGHSLKLDVIAEGIESEGSLHYLQERGCQQAQGYWFSRPLKAEDFAQWCLERQAA